jgi:hypothetical protein
VAYMSAPRTFHTTWGSYAGLCGVLSLPLLLAAWRALSGGLVDRTELLIVVLLPAIAALWLACFRLRLDDSGIEYRDLFGRSFRVAYSQVDSLKTRTLSSGRGIYRQWTLHLGDGRDLRINLKPFPGEAYKVLSERLHRDAWMSLSLSRLLSLLVTAVAYLSAWPMQSGFWLVTLGCGPLLVLRSTRTLRPFSSHRWGGSSCCCLLQDCSWCATSAIGHTD